MTPAHWRSAAAAALFAVSAWAGGASPAEANGYWTCSSGEWVAMGEPRHPMPVKTCGFTLEIPQTQTGCEAVGGAWGPAGIFPKPICKVPTRDAGRLCGDAGGCEGTCVASLTPDQRDLVIKNQDLQISGQCTPRVPLFGCLAIVEKGVVHGMICRD